MKPIPTSLYRIALMVVLVLGGLGLQPHAADAQAGTVYATESGLYIETVQVRDGTVYYGGLSCGPELVNPKTYLRAQAASTGPARSLHDAVGQPCALSNYALDDQYVYWINAGAQLLRVSRGGAGNPTPTAVTPSMSINATTAYTLRASSAYFAWSEIDYNGGTSRLVRAPRGGGSGQALALGGLVTDIALDPNGVVYYRLNNTLVRATASAASFTTTTIGTSGRVQTFALNGSTLYWIETTPTPGQFLVYTAPLSNPTSGVLLNSFNRAGNPSVLSLTVDPVNLYWVEFSQPVNRAFYRLPLTGGTAVLIGDSADYGGEIAADGRFLYYTDTDVSGPTLVGRVRRIPIDAIGADLAGAQATIEVVQAIQGPTNDVPLVAGKDTFARVYVQTQNAQSGVLLNPAPLVELYGSRGGQPLPGSPLLPIRAADGVNNAALDRRGEANSALFHLPATWASGTIDLRAEINPVHSVVESTYANNTLNTSVTFNTVPRPCLFMVPVATVSGTLTGPSPTFTPFFDRAVSVWPVDAYNVDFDAGPAQRRPKIPFGIGGSDPYNLNSDFELGYLLWNLWWTYNFSTGYACAGAGTTTVAAVPNALRYGMASAGVLTYLQNNGGSAASWSMPQGGIAGLAHELGHAWGRGHVDCGGPAFPAPFPYPPCQLDGTDGPLSHVGFDPLTFSVIPPTPSADYMSYSDPIWTSDHTYRGLYDSLRSAGGLSVSADAPAAWTSAILVTGLLGANPQIGYGVRLTGAELDAVANRIGATMPATNDYHLVAFDASGNVISDDWLNVSQPSAEGGSTSRIFAGLVGGPTPPVRVEVRTGGGTTLVQRSAGATPPTVAWVSPTAGATAGATIEARWSASDADGDRLMTTVRYSPDNGGHWFVMGSPTQDQALSIPVDGALPGGAQARIEVIVSDGVNSTSVVSPAFVVPQRAPTVAILDTAYRQLGPSQPGGAQQSEGLSLRAYAYDAEDGTLAGSALQWNLTGPETRSGTGTTIAWRDLKPGTYQITLTGSDTAGATAQATAPFTIAPKRIFDAAFEPRLDGVCDDGAYVDDRDSIGLRYLPGLSDVAERNAQLRLVRWGDSLYACFAGLTWGNQPDGSAALQFDFQAAPTGGFAPTDRGFFVRKNGMFFTGTGSNGAGTGLAIDADPVGLTAAVSRDGNFWSAEMRIALDQIGGWNQIVRLEAAHYWRDYTGDDTLWPRNSGYNQPGTWGLVALGSQTQSITFGPLANRRLGDGTFVLDATASSGMPVAYTATGPCAVVGNAVQLSGLGLCTITASQTGNGAFAPAQSVDRSFSVQSMLFLPSVRR